MAATISNKNLLGAMRPLTRMRGVLCFGAVRVVAERDGFKLVEAVKGKGK